MTQAVYDGATARRILDLAAPLGIPVLLGLMPLVSGRNAEFLHHEVPGIVVPDDVRRRMKGLRGKEGRAEGLRILAETAAAVAGRARGFYIIPPFENHEHALRALDAIESAGALRAPARAEA